MKNIIHSLKRFFAPPKVHTILVIDDSEIDRRVACSMLEKHYNVRLANGGREGIAMAIEKRPDLILLDFMMPEM